MPIGALTPNALEPSTDHCFYSRQVLRKVQPFVIMLHDYNLSISRENKAFIFQFEVFSR